MIRPKSWSGPWALVAATAAATTALGVPVREALHRWDAMDVPNHRSSHRSPVARGGGIAAVLGVGVASLVTGQRPSTRRVGAVLTLAGVGLADDITGHVPPWVRLTAQIASGAGLLADEDRNRPIAGLATPSIVNVVNFMDGINGITGACAVVWGVNAILSDDESGGDLAALGAVTAGAGLGFLPHNVPTARMFLGDVGSYAIGGAMAAGIVSQRSLRGRYRAAAPLLLYGVDAIQALVHRARAGETLTEAHRDHIYQQLVDEGWGHVEVAAFHTALAAVVALGARRSWPSAALIAIAASAAYLHSIRASRTLVRAEGRRGRRRRGDARARAGESSQR